MSGKGSELSHADALAALLYLCLGEAESGRVRSGRETRSFISSVA